MERGGHRRAADDCDAAELKSLERLHGSHAYGGGFGRSVRAQAYGGQARVVEGLNGLVAGLVEAGADADLFGQDTIRRPGSDLGDEKGEFAFLAAGGVEMWAVAVQGGAVAEEGLVAVLVLQLCDVAAMRCCPSTTIGL